MTRRQAKALRAKKKQVVVQRAPGLGRELAMPKYGYQNPVGGSLVVRYDEVEERKKKAAPVPALQNFNFAV